MRTPEPEDPLPAGGFLVDMAAHDYDAACWFLGQEPTVVHAVRQASVYPQLEPLGDLDNAAVTLSFDAGGIASLHISRTCPWGHDVRVEVVGDEGSILIGNRASRDGVTLMGRADASQSAGNNLATLRHKLSEQPDVFIINCLYFLHTEFADFLAAKIFTPPFAATRAARTRGAAFPTITRGTISPRRTLPARTAFRRCYCSNFFSHDAP